MNNKGLTLEDQAKILSSLCRSNHCVKNFFKKDKSCPVKKNKKCMNANKKVWLDYLTQCNIAARPVQNKLSKIYIDHNFLKKVIDKYGYYNQLLQLQEEAAELVAEISHFRRKHFEDSTKLIQEIADVEIMIHQMRIVFGDTKIDDAIILKLNRLYDTM